MKKTTVKKPGRTPASITKTAKKLVKEFGGKRSQVDRSFIAIDGCNGLFVYIQKDENGFTTGINCEHPGPIPYKRIKQVADFLKGCGYTMNNFEFILTKS
jgi:hypothetical protein